jgi:hypothetical protein
MIPRSKLLGDNHQIIKQQKHHFCGGKRCRIHSAFLMAGIAGQRVLRFSWMELDLATLVSPSFTGDALKHLCSIPTSKIAFATVTKNLV